VYTANEIISKVGIKSNKDNKDIIGISLSFLNYMKIGEKIIVNNDSSYEKISEDLIYIDSKVDKSNVVDYLEENKVVNLSV